jgi:sortase (surface protein transpeptidase)
MIDKIKNWLIIILIAFGLFYYISDSIKESKINKLNDKLTQAESKIENLELARKADVATNNEKAKLKDKINGSKDLDNLNHVPDSDILNQLRSDPI